MTRPTIEEREIAVEQGHLDVAHRRLDAERADTRAQLAAARSDQTAVTPQGRFERDAVARHLEHRIAQLDAAGDQVCFGRLDLDDGDTLHIGRIGLADDDHDVLVVDWRAPAASAFYRATPLDPHHVTRRRHITARRRQVVRVDDDLLEGRALDADGRATLVGEAALLAAVDEHRTDRMGNIVATIQTEQDRIIRAPLRQVLVVQGGPGTGKTAVALHRAAYLLYEHRDLLAVSGILVVGPNTRFLRYIDNVIPELGETAVALAALGELHPGVSTTIHDRAEVATVKGDLRMADVVADAVAAHQRIPARDHVLRLGHVEVPLRRVSVDAARRTARRADLPHNEARAIFRRSLHRRVTRHIEQAVMDEIDREIALLRLPESDQLAAIVDVLWPSLRAEELVATLYGDDDVNRRATRRHLDASEAGSLRRDRGSPWTIEDVPILDEAARQLGPIEQSRADADRTAAAQGEHHRRRQEAEDVIAATDTGWVIDAEELLARYEGPVESSGVSTEARRDGSWKFGHVIVDEAQELSPMQWRAVSRRCASRSMTVVGDIAQRSAPAAADTWSDALRAHLQDHWTFAELTVNYRSPAEIEPLATAILTVGGIDAVHPTAVRATGVPPEVVTTDDGALGATTREVVRRLLGADERGTCAVVTARGVDLSPTLEPDRRVTVVDVDDVKGLEFDSVVVVDPDAILDAPRGHHDLYVAVTRSTQRLVVVVDATASGGAWTAVHDVATGGR